MSRTKISNTVFRWAVENGVNWEAREGVYVQSVLLQGANVKSSCLELQQVCRRPPILDVKLSLWLIISPLNCSLLIKKCSYFYIYSFPRGIIIQANSPSHLLFSPVPYHRSTVFMTSIVKSTFTLPPHTAEQNRNLTLLSLQRRSAVQYQQQQELRLENINCFCYY